MKLLRTSPAGRRYNQAMFVAVVFMRLFEIMFFCGVAGSVVVVLISLVEDLQLLVGE
jgi:hypothetical protein